jgi:hypothetical protein
MEPKEALASIGLISTALSFICILGIVAGVVYWIWSGWDDSWRIMLTSFVLSYFFERLAKACKKEAKK